MRLSQHIYKFSLPPFLPSSSENDGADRRLHCLSNPSFFTINEVAVGITTNDVLCHLSGDEVRTLPMSTFLMSVPESKEGAGVGKPTRTHATENTHR